ncbi:hypothetical protein ZYGR_0AS04250 [Zygosaccharomyces rouxii]|uniref:Pre-mRNA-processing factor 17 n=1 Tax=Zygosaccharomyces rouxii TaxID=4956 RepID=A0A1Q3AHK1_ZYGRO|nr:hypothetical protein ZYGR_0AS04250 [Zygosaccharomyces rouxii]
MSLVNYSSSSEDEENVKTFRDDRTVSVEGSKFPEANTKANGSDIKRRKLTKSEIRKDRQSRKGRGPWAAWSSGSSSNSSSEEAEPGTETGFDGLKDENDNDTDENPRLEENEEKSTFYGDNEVDYQGRGFLHPPVEVDLDFYKQDFKCYLPKRRIHSFAGHARGTSALQFLPKTGHLFLSGGNDNTLKIWDLYHDRICLRDYKGHNKPIKTVNFNEDGTTFLSASFDQNVKLWDTETGQVKSRYKFNATPNDIQYRPGHSNEFVVGLSNSKINHYDDRVAAKHGLVQVYDHHLSSILNLEFFPDGSKLISSSEDKTVRIWENQINIPIKQISDTAQHSMPFLRVHPEHHYFCAQSMDNVIYSFGMKPKYKRHPNKLFSGHQSAGYGIHIDFSPDGHYIVSGDSRGKLMVWDWTTTKLLKSLEVLGRQPVTQVAWHPQETSKVLCSGNMGKIHLFD